MSRAPLLKSLLIWEVTPIGLVMIPRLLSIVLLFCFVVSGHMTSSCSPRLSYLSLLGLLCYDAVIYSSLRYLHCSHSFKISSNTDAAPRDPFLKLLEITTV